MKARLLLMLVFGLSQALVLAGSVTAQAVGLPGSQLRPHTPAGHHADLPTSPVSLGQPGTSFRYVQTLGVTDEAYPADTQHLNRPNGLFVDGGDNLYVAEGVGSRMLKFDSTGSHLLTIGTAGLLYSANYVFRGAQDVAVDGSGNIWVVDFNRAVEYTSTGAFVQQIPSSNPAVTGSDNQHFNGAVGIAFDSSGRMYVSDINNQRIQVFQIISGTASYSTTIGIAGVIGADNAHFYLPFMIAVDASDRLYVMDSLNYRVQRCVFTMTWACSTFYGGNGAGSNLNQIGDASGLAVDRANHVVYIADAANHRVLKCPDTFPGTCTSSMLFAGVTGTPGADNGHFRYANDVAVDSAGNVYVADGDNDRVQKFNSAGQYLSTLGTIGVPYVANTSRYNAPWGLTLTSDGSLYVTENRGERAIKLNSAGVQQWAYGVAGVPGNDNAHLGSFWGSQGNPAVDASGHLFVPDSGNSRIVILDTGGQFLASFGSQGITNNQFQLPGSVFIRPTDGNIYVADIWNHRVQVYDNSWVYQATVGVTTTSGSDNTHFDSPGGVAVDADGNIFVADTNNHRVQKCMLVGSTGTCTTFAGQTGTPGSSFDQLSSPKAVALDAAGRVYVADDGNSRVQVFDASGAYLATLGGAWGASSGQLRSATGVAVDAAGNVYVADPTANRIQEFALGVPGWRQNNLNGFGDVEDGALWAQQIFNGRLYAGGYDHVNGAKLWRSVDGRAWEPATPPGLIPGNTVIADLAVFHTQLYAASAFVGPSQLWRSTDGLNWTAVITDGLGHNNTNYEGLARLAVFSDTLYAGTYNFTGAGVQIWRSSTGDSLSWTNVVTNGFDADTHDYYLTNLAQFGNYLYATSANNAGGAEIWRTADGTQWNQVNADGFGSAANSEPGGLAELGGYLYLSTRNNTTGAQIWRSPDGANWSPVMTNGFGDSNNQKIQSLLALDGFLYADVDNQVTGVEIWRSADGIAWTQINPDGWGDSNTAGAAAGSLFAFNGQLSVGAGNGASGAKLWELLPNLVVTGQISANAAGLAGVQVSAGGALSATTDASGNYTFTQMLSGQYTLAPTLDGYTFTPVTRTVSLPPDALGQDFAAQAVTPVPSSTPTATATSTPTAASTPTPTATSTRTATSTPTATPTLTPTPVVTATSTATMTPTSTSTPTPTGTVSPTPSPTATPTTTPAALVTWTAPLTLTHSAGNSRLPNIFVDDQDTVHVVWTQDSCPWHECSVYYASKPAGQAWSAPTLLETAPAGGSYYGVYWPHVVSDHLGNVTACWSERYEINSPPPGVVNIYCRTKPSGGAWSAPVLVTSNFAPGWAYNAGLVVDGQNTLHIVFRSASLTGGPSCGSGTCDVWHAQQALGGSWTGFEKITPSQTLLGTAALTASGAGDLHVVWTSCSNPVDFTTCEILYSTRPVSGTWSSPLNLSNNATISDGGWIAVDGNNNLHVAWHDQGLSGKYDVYAIQRAAAGGAWSAPVNLSSNSGDSVLPVLAFDHLGNLQASWLDDTPGKSQVFYSAQLSGSGAWTAPVNLSNDAGSAYQQSSLAIDSQNNVHLVWSDDSSGPLQVYYREGPALADGPTATPTPSATLTVSPVVSITSTLTATPTRTATPTSTRTPTVTPTRTPTSTSVGSGGGTTYAASGRVTLGAVGLPGVQVSAGSLGALTDISGTYHLTGLLTGTYTLTASLSGYTFSPPARLVSLPPDAASQNFSATAVSLGGTLFSDDFSGDLSRWQMFNGTWAIANGELSGAGAGGSLDAQIYAGDPAWTDYALSARVDFVSGGNAGFYLRSTGRWQNEYRIDLWAADSPFPNTYEVIKYQNGTPYHLGASQYNPAPLPLTSPIEVRIEARGSVLNVYFNGTPADPIVDPAPLANGRIGFNVIWTDQAHFDNVVVTNLAATRYSAAGRVTDNTHVAVPGVLVSTDAGGSAVTDGNGLFTITQLLTGTYTLTPTLTGYTFAPPARVVSVPPDGANQNFTAQAAAAASSLLATASAGYANILVTWDWNGVLPNIAGLAGYQVYRSANGGALVPLTTAPLLTSQYLDTSGLASGGQYCYQVQAVDGAGGVLSLSNSPCATYGELVLWTPDLVAPPGAHDILVPVNLSNGDGLCMGALQLILSYDPSVVVATGAISRTIYTAGYSFAADTSTPGQVSIAAIGNSCQALYGAGTLFNVGFNVTASAGQVSPLDFVTGLTATVIYADSDLFHPVPLALTSGSLLVSNAYFRGDVNGDTVINVADAALALQIASGAFSPTAQQQTACDVSGDGLCNSADASLLLCYVAYHNWDVCGTPAVTRPAPRSAPLAVSTVVTISLGTPAGSLGQTVSVPVSLQGGAEFAGGTFSFRYDPTRLTFAGVTLTSLTNSFSLKSHVQQPGLVRVALAHATKIGAGGPILNLQFTLTGAPVPLGLAQFRLNDNAGRDFETSALQKDIVVAGAGSPYRLYLPRVSR